MSRRSIISLGFSVLAAAVLLIPLLVVSRADLDDIGNQVLAMRPAMLLVLVALLGINVFISGEKWRLVDRRLRGEEDALPRPLYFGLTALGTMFGLLVPVQLSAAVARFLGLHWHGSRATARGTAASFVEQGYDVLVAGFLALASTALLIAGGNAAEWILFASLAGAASLLVSATGAGLLLRNLKRLAPPQENAPRGRIFAIAESVGGSGLLRREVVQPLCVLSLLRFFILTLMAATTTAAFGLHVPVWQLSAALPLAILATALPITPGGLGTVEWAFASALVAFGTELETAAQWAILNRVAVTLASMIVGVAGALVAILVHSKRASSQTARRRCR